MSLTRQTLLAARGVEPMPAEAAALEFEAVFQQYWKPVCSVIYRIVGDWPESEDLAVEVFLQLHRRPPPESGPQLSGWLYRVATNLALNALRSRQRRQRYETEAALQENRERNPDDPAWEVQRRQERQQVQAVLVKMKPRSAQLLILRQAGLSYAEIAQALAMAPGSVGKLLARAEADFERRYRRENRD